MHNTCADTEVRTRQDLPLRGTGSSARNIFSRRTTHFDLKTEGGDGEKKTVLVWGLTQRRRFRGKVVLMHAVLETMGILLLRWYRNLGRATKLVCFSVLVQQYEVLHAWGRCRDRLHESTAFSG